METLKPKLRFSEFKDNWSVISLGEAGEFIGGGTPSTSNNEFWNGNINWFTPTEIKSDYVENSLRKISSKGLLKSSAKLLPKGTILLTTRATIGDVAISTKECSTNQGFQSLITNYNNNNYFYFNWFKKNKHLLMEKANGSTFPEISKSALESIKLAVPLLEEQSKIANFLSSIDEKINLLKEKKSLLEEYKKGIMQKIFNQEIRFKDDNGNDYMDWEEKSLGEIGDIITGKTPSTSDSELWGGDIQFITPTDIKEGNKYQENTVRYVTNNNKLKILPINSIVYTCIASIGKMCISRYPSITNQQINSLVINQLNSFEYVYYWLLYITPFIKSTQANTTLPIINKTEFSKFTIQLPCVNEQTKIANFLSAIDEKIELVSNQLQDTQEYKKGLLQQMFV
jgi:type I restriction enzyme S subunit